MSDTAVAQAPTPEIDNSNRIKGVLALTAAILLGLAATLTAWGAYRESLVSDNVLKGYAQQQALIAEANDFYGRSDAERSLEEQFFLQFAIQSATGNTDAVAYLEQAMSEQMLNALSWWAEQPDESGPVSPFVEENPFYAELPSQQFIVAGDELIYQAEAKRAEAETADSLSDRFGLANVFFAIVLFLAGVATLLGRWKVQIGVIVLSTAMLIAGLIILVTTPTWLSTS